ncbi:hypothetical protein BST37_15920 [Mycobacterium noviomagense]|uniref:Uncharacterized protein n=1 Tax=Mycobacterium noviomagense TaxID=459858 RepID=A0ABX3T4P8_9MYCO|nr:hypothetical protein BST37_15920 [Mycobacterium noviomagense]
MSLLHRIRLGAQVVEGQLDVRIIHHFLVDLAVYLKDAGPSWFRLLYCSADRPLKDITIYRSFDFQEQAELPFRAGVTRFLRKPYV